MSKYTLMKPANVDELAKAINMIQTNKTHVNAIRADETLSAILIELDGMAHFAGHHDAMMPIKRGQISHANDVLGRIRGSLEIGSVAPRPALTELFDLVDQTRN